MRILIHCAIATKSSGIVTDSACGILLKATDKHKRIKIRQMSFWLQNHNEYQAHVKCARLALSSIMPIIRSSEVIICVGNKELADFMTSNENIDNVDGDSHQLQQWISYYGNLSVVLTPDDAGDMLVAKNLARTALDTQQPYDSLTMDG